MMTSLCIVVPLYNDWPSLAVLLRQLNAVASGLSIRIFVIIVNDGSTEPQSWHADEVGKLTSLVGVEIVHLSANVGHQRAIAIGLCVAVEEYDPDAVLVMDGDGEDPPEQIPALVSKAQGMKDFCIVAQRRKRTEKLTFQISYLIYKLVFRSVTGKTIDFGNFSLTSRTYARRLVTVSELWNNMAAAVLRSRLPVLRVPIDRGHRYAGTSKMNFVSLIVHGLSGVSVYAETILVRLLLLTIGLFLLTVASVAVVISLRVFLPEYATPGWATTVSFGMVIILTQVLFTTLLSIIALLNNRVQALIIPRREFRNYIETRELVVGSTLRSEA